MRVVTEWITCPHCWERVEIELDLSVPEQHYVEDCFVCCRPIKIHYRTGGECVEALDASAENA